jgi:transcriptional regulator with XRE-family HTH domain
MRKMCFRENLIELLNEQKVTQQKIATAIGVSQRAVSKWINGQAEPTATNIFKLAVYFGVSADYLLGFSDD